MRFLLVLIFAATTASSAMPVSLLPKKHAVHPKVHADEQARPRRAFPGAVSRGGSSIQCGDSNLNTALKTALSTALETCGLLGVLAGATRLSQKFPLFTLSGLPVLQWVSAFLTIFASSSIKSVLDGGVSAASNQALRPDVVPGEAGWYANLKKPWFNPPGWLFPIMWLIVSKPTQLFAVSVLLKTQSVGKWPALAVYCAHLSLGDAWNQVFFGCQRIGLGAGVIVTFWGMLARSAFLFHKIDSTAGLLMLPTVGWVTVASALNLEIYRLNKSEKK